MCNETDLENQLKKEQSHAEKIKHFESVNPYFRSKIETSSVCIKSFVDLMCDGSGHAETILKMVLIDSDAARINLKTALDSYADRVHETLLVDLDQAQADVFFASQIDEQQEMTRLDVEFSEFIKTLI